MPESVLYDVDRRVATITLNRPEKLNAISFQMQDEIVAAIGEAERDDAVGAVVIAGAGRAFSAGYDLADPSRPAPSRDEASSASIARDRDSVQRRLTGWLRIWDARIPVIAKVHGHCLAGGAQLACICDVTIAAEDARVGGPSVPLGAGFGAAFWAWFIGPRKAKELYFTVGHTISGREAAEMGLFNLAVPADQLDESVERYAQAVVKKPKELLALEKQAINRTQEIQGFREALMQSVDVDALAHFTGAATEIRLSLREKGLKATLAAFRDPPG